MTSVIKDVGKLEPLFIAARMKTDVAFMEISSEVPQKTKCRITYNPAISFMSIYQKELKAESQTSICMPVFIAPLFIIAKR